MTKTATGDELGVYVFRRDDGTTITIVHNEFIVAMYGPKGRKFFPSLQKALMCASEHGFKNVTSFDYV